MHEEHTTAAELPPFVARDWILVNEDTGPEWYPAFTTSIVKVVCPHGRVQIWLEGYAAGIDEIGTYDSPALALHQLGILECQR